MLVQLFEKLKLQKKSSGYEVSVEFEIKITALFFYNRLSKTAMKKMLCLMPAL